MKTTLISSAVLLFVCFSCHSCNKDKTLEQSVEKQFLNQAGKKHNINESLFLLHSDSRDIHLKFSRANNPEVEVPKDKSFHTASISKTFTAVLIAILYEEGAVDFQDPISKYLDRDMLEGLFVVDGTDHSAEVRIHHLLNHTSGAADFYEDKPR